MQNYFSNIQFANHKMVVKNEMQYQTEVCVRLGSHAEYKYFISFLTQ